MWAVDPNPKEEPMNKLWIAIGIGLLALVLLPVVAVAQGGNHHDIWFSVPDEPGVTECHTYAGFCVTNYDATLYYWQSGYSRAPSRLDVGERFPGYDPISGQPVDYYFYGDYDYLSKPPYTQTYVQFWGYY